MTEGRAVHCKPWQVHHILGLSCTAASRSFRYCCRRSSHLASAVVQQFKHVVASGSHRLSDTSGPGPDVGGFLGSTHPFEAGSPADSTSSAPQLGQDSLRLAHQESDHIVVNMDAQNTSRFVYECRCECVATVACVYELQCWPFGRSALKCNCDCLYMTLYVNGKTHAHQCLVKGSNVLATNPLISVFPVKRVGCLHQGWSATPPARDSANRCG